MSDFTEKISQKVSDAKDAVIDGAAKMKRDAAHAKVDADYSTNKAGVSAAKWVEDKASDLKKGVSGVKHDLQKNQF